MVIRQPSSRNYGGSIEKYRTGSPYSFWFIGDKTNSLGLDHQRAYILKSWLRCRAFKGPLCQREMKGNWHEENQLFTLRCGLCFHSLHANITTTWFVAEYRENNSTSALGKLFLWVTFNTNSGFPSNGCNSGPFKSMGALASVEDGIVPNITASFVHLSCLKSTGRLISHQAYASTQLDWHRRTMRDVCVCVLCHIYRL